MCIIASLVIVTFLSCNGGISTKRSDMILQNIKEAFPNSRVYKNPKETFVFIVVDSSGVKEVSMLNLSDDNISEILVFPEQK